MSMTLRSYIYSQFNTLIQYAILFKTVNGTFIICTGKLFKEFDGGICYYCLLLFAHFMKLLFLLKSTKYSWICLINRLTKQKELTKHLSPNLLWEEIRNWYSAKAIVQITNSWKRRLIGLWLAHITFLNLTSQLPLNEKSTTLKEYLFSRRYNGKTEISNILNLVFFCVATCPRWNGTV